MLRGTSGLRPALRDDQKALPVCLCSRCRGEVYPGESTFFWEGRWVCSDCFRVGVTVWLEEAAQETAQALGVETRWV